jgi:glycosyltransferase involved in cell wall biosynthesis
VPETGHNNMHTLKILHVIPYMHPAAGGPPVVVDRLSRELVARGHEVRVLTTDLLAGGDRAWATAERRPYALDVYPAARGNGYGFSREFGHSIRTAVAKYDVVHLHTLWTYASLAAARACRQANVPYLVMPHGMLDPHSVRRGWLKKQVYGRVFEWPLLRRARGMCYTHPEEERLAAQTCRRLPRGYIVELGVESPPDCRLTDLRAEFLDRHPELRSRTVVLFLGRVHAKKGLDLLIPAFDRVSQRQPDAHLLIVGPGEPDYIASIRREVAARHLGRKVTFTGLLSGRDKWAAMAASDLFVLPSYQENFALAAVDAIRSGLPVLLSRRVNLWKDVVDARAGRDCETTVDSVTETLNACLADAVWRTEAAEAGARLLTTRFNWAKTAAGLEESYLEVSRMGF